MLQLPQPSSKLQHQPKQRVRQSQQLQESRFTRNKQRKRKRKQLLTFCKQLNLKHKQLLSLCRQQPIPSNVQSQRPRVQLSLDRRRIEGKVQQHSQTTRCLLKKENQNTLMSREQLREPGATHQMCNVQDKIQGKATLVLKEATPALNQATTEADPPQSTNKPPVVPTKQPCSEQRKQISFDDVRSINELLERCISPGSTPPLARSKSAGTIPVVRASPDLNLAASKEAINSGEETHLLQRSKSGSVVWDDYCPAPPFNLGIDEAVEKKEVEGNGADHKGMAKDKGVANVPATTDIEWGIDWGNLDFDQVVEVAAKSVAADGAGRMSPSGFSTPPEDPKKPGEEESSKGAASSSDEPVP